MKFPLIAISILMIFLLLSATGQALPNTQLFVHRESNIYFSVTNFGIIGSQEGQFHDYEGYFDPAPGAEFPADSEIEHLFFGAIWIGAVVDTNDYPNQLDTLVSIGNDGWWGNIFELWPEEVPFGSIVRDSTLADEEIYAVYYDTVTSDIVVPDPNDQRPHIPIGLRITQHSMGWNFPGNDEFFIINYNLQNLYNRDLHDVWLGVYYDGDVFHSSEGSQGYQDDLCGFIEYGDHGIAWIADNDGQPNVGGQYGDSSSTGLMGMFLLGASESGLQTNFNWWISNVNAVYDWGPQLQSNFDIWGVFPGGGRGTPGGDAAKYQVMSNGERDYDQAFCALDHTGEGWITNAPNVDNLADGYDTRFLLSLGPLDIAAGDEERISIGYIGGHDLHTDPTNFAINLENNVGDSLSIVEYYNNLDFSDLFAKADLAQQFYQNLFVEVWPGDLDNNGIVEAADILPLAEFWHESGLLRDNVDYGWYAHETFSWSGFSDAVYADANGDGLINISDFPAICLNWGLTHDGIVYLDIDHGNYDIEAYRDVLMLLYNQVKNSDSGPQLEIRLFLENLLGLSLPEEFAVNQNYPNPFNLSTIISYRLPYRSEITLSVYNIAGQLVKELEYGIQEAGVHKAVWDGCDESGIEVSSGLYFYKFQSSDPVIIKKMMLLK